MKRILSLFLAALMVLSLAACGAEPAAPEASEEPAVTEAPVEEPTAAETPAEEPASSGTHIVVDFKGEETEVPDEIDRVVILGPLPAATVYAVFMGGDISKLVGVTPDLKNGVEYSVFAKYCPEIMDVSSDFYAGGQLNMEELVKLDPDVVFYHSESDAEPIRQAGIPAVGLTHPNKGGSASPLETLRSWMDTYAQTFRMTSSAQDIIAYGEEVESEIRSRIEANPTESVEKYLYINTYSDSGLVIAGAKSFAAWWTDLLGAENLGARATNSSVNMEQIYEWNPDKIFILTFGQDPGGHLQQHGGRGRLERYHGREGRAGLQVSLRHAPLVAAVHGYAACDVVVGEDGLSGALHRRRYGRHGQGVLPEVVRHGVDR